MVESYRTSSGGTPQPWVRLAVPSVADSIFVALLGTLVFTPLAVRLLGDAGIGWHIRAGQQIMATHVIPHVDSFSSSMQGKPWFAWEWLYDILAGELDANLGLNGVVWLIAVVIAATFAWLFRLLLARGTHMLIALALFLLALSASTIHFLARPHVFSWLFTLAWFWILDSSEPDGLAEKDRSRMLWMLPLLMLIWVNVHGGLLLGFVLLGIFWLAAVWNWFRAGQGRIEGVLQKIASRNRARDLAAVGVLSIAASLVNPYGWKLHSHIYSYLSNRFVMDHVAEFQSPNFHDLAPKCFLVLLLIAIAAFVARGRELRMSQVLTALFAIYTGLYASRNLPVSSILLAMVVGPLISSKTPAQGFFQYGFFQRMTELESSLRGHIWPIAAILVTLWIAANTGRIGSKVVMNAHFDSKRMPVEAVNFLEKFAAKGPVLSTDYWGGYLIYRLYPRVQVVVDDRHDLYGAEFFKFYLKMLRGESGWEEFLGQHEASCLLLPKDAALSNILLEGNQWKAIYQDDVGIVFVRNPASH
jgi:hypothetical protein